ncbi:aldo/keto reductase family protein [Methylomonas rapida]|uniref:Aldo/keto reductase n=1 Tax=Methylomonas rapida TaxID=2963939 RepID=A0ABY7GHI2_9GAMM|nr:aldo/keto reductase [Methylomonas rapida]WAR43956.1 aldo/keto reductase [Methylomonas rapida]
MTHIDYVTSNYGVRVPRILYGTAWKKERTAQLVEQALALGFRGVDTACQPKHYHEAGVGEALQASFARGGLSRDQIYLQTKFTPVDGHSPQRIPYDPKAPLAEQVLQSFQVSLKNLQTDYLDGLILHSPLPDRQQLLEVWHAMEGIFLEGNAKDLGISNCYDLGLFKFLYAEAAVKPAIIQNRFYRDTGFDAGIREFCRQQGIIYQSFWTLTANPRILASATIEDLAAEYRRSPAQIFFRYLTQIGIVPLTGTTSAQHMTEDLAIFEFELTEEECLGITHLL